MKKLFVFLLVCSLAMANLSAQAVDKDICSGTAFTINSTAAATAGSEYRWLENGSVISGATSANYTIPSTKPGGVYTYVRQSKSGDCSDWQGSNAYTVSVGHKPGDKATMQNFFPCNYTTNSTWVLTDARADAGSQTYTVRYLADGRYWMVDDLKYPTACNKTTFSGAESTGSAGKNGISGFIGDCRNNTQSGAGYLYDWMGAMQDTRLYYLSTTNPNCGTNCRGICPAGWHLPAQSEFVALNNAVNGGSTSSDAGLKNSSTFNGVYGGYSANNGSLNYQGSYAYYWSSTYYSTDYAYNLSFYSTNVNPSISNFKNNGSSVRCLRNY